MNRVTTILVLLGFLAAAGPVQGQSKAGTAIGQFLGIEPSARHAGMGNAGVGVGEGIASVYFNPGVIGTLDRPAIEITHSPWFADITFDYGATAVPVRDWGTLFFSVTSLNSGDIAVRTVDQPLGTGEQFTVGDVALAIGFGRRITDRLTGGAQVTYVEERIWHSSLRFVTLGFGSCYRLTEGGLFLGSSISSVGTRARFSGRDLAIQFDADPTAAGDNGALPAEQFTERFPVPVLFRVGLGLPRRMGAHSRLLLALDALHPSNNVESMNVGAEWTWEEFLALRAGYQTLFQRDSELGWTFGTGVGTEMGQRWLQFDYSWAAHRHLEATHRLTLALSL